MSTIAQSRLGENGGVQSARKEAVTTAVSSPHVAKLMSLLGLAMLLIVVTILAIGKGAVEIEPKQVIAILLNRFGISIPVEYEARQEVVLNVIRLPRVILGLFVGATLGVSGASIQGLFRNPLADPGLIGISSGAALAVAWTIVLGNTVLSGFTAFFGNYSLTVAAFGGGIVTTLLIYRLASLGGRTNISTMLLAGIAINALSGAGIGMMTYIASEDQLRDITFWSMGSLGRANWEVVSLMVPFLLIATVSIPFIARALNAFLLGEQEAEHLGIHIERIKLVVVIMVALSVGAGVAVAGIIGFVGLVVPHLIRLMMGPDHRYLLPGSALLGASLLIGADLVARTVAVPSEVPIGIVTALMGAPFFLWLLLRDRGRVSL